MGWGRAGKDGLCKRGIAGQRGGSTLAGDSWREVGSRELGRGRRHHPLRLRVCLAKEFLIPGLCLDKQEGVRRESQTERESKLALGQDANLLHGPFAPESEAPPHLLSLNTGLSPLHHNATDPV